MQKCHVILPMHFSVYIPCGIMSKRLTGMAEAHGNLLSGDYRKDKVEGLSAPSDSLDVLLCFPAKHSCSS